MFSFLKKSSEEDASNEFTIYSPCKGMVVPLEDLVDENFSKKRLGEGIAINPNIGHLENRLQLRNISTEAVIDISQAIPYAVFSFSQLKIRLYIGTSETVVIPAGIQSHIESGMHYPLDTLILDINTDCINPYTLSTVLPIVITNPELVESFDILAGSGAIVEEGQEIMHIKLKKFV